MNTTDPYEKERRILRMMRQVLGDIVKEATPAVSERAIFSERTLEGIRDCFAVISLREREIAEELQLAQAKPHFSDEAAAVQAVAMPKPRTADTDKH